MVVPPPAVAVLLGNFLNEADDGPPDSRELVLVLLLLLQVGEELRGVGQELNTVILGVDRQTFAKRPDLLNRWSLSWYLGYPFRRGIQGSISSQLAAVSVW